MPNLVTDLIVNRVDLVEEGANSAAFIELFKRKEPMLMTVEEILLDLKPEHADILKAKIALGDKAEQDLAKTNTDLATALADLEKAKQDKQDAENKLPCECDGEADENGTCKTCGRKKAAKSKEGAAFDETETLKSMPKEAREYFEVLKAKASAAEDELRKARQKEVEDKAIAKAATLKSLPVEEKVLVGILKSASKEVLDILDAANTAIETAVLGEVGKAGGSTIGAKDANVTWNKIESEADKIVKSAAGTITKAKAITQVIKDQPELYKQYVDGGAE